MATPTGKEEEAIAVVVRMAQGPEATAGATGGQDWDMTDEQNDSEDY